jgi:hypothetical protein
MGNSYGLFNTNPPELSKNKLLNVSRAVGSIHLVRMDFSPSFNARMKIRAVGSAHLLCIMLKDPFLWNLGAGVALFNGLKSVVTILGEAMPLSLQTILISPTYEKSHRLETFCNHGF